MKILMVVTSHDQLGSTGRKTGLWLEEPHTLSSGTPRRTDAGLAKRRTAPDRSEERFVGESDSGDDKV